MSKINCRNRERGSALVVALVVVAVLSALITAYSIGTMGEAKLAGLNAEDTVDGGYKLTVREFLADKAGVEGGEGLGRADDLAG